MDKQNIQTSDLYLAATLLAYGCDLINIDRDKPDRQVFVFEKLPQQIWVLSANGNEIRLQIPISLEEMRALKMSERLVYPPKFVRAIHEVKSCLHAD